MRRASRRQPDLERFHVPKLLFGHVPLQNLCFPSRRIPDAKRDLRTTASRPCWRSTRAVNASPGLRCRYNRVQPRQALQAAGVRQLLADDSALGGVPYSTHEENADEHFGLARETLSTPR